MKASKGRRSFLATCGLAAAAAARPLAAFGQAVDNAKQASSPSALRITDLKCGYVRGSLFVKVHTNQGIWGCGEGVDAIGGTYNLVQSFGQRIRGQNPLNVHRIFEQVRKGGVFGGAQSGVFVAVLSAVETALWDLAGKALNVPVYQLLGGKFRDKIRVYCDTALYQTRAARAGAVRLGGVEGRQGRLYRDEVRPGSGRRSQQVRSVQLDREPGGSPAHGRSVDGRAAGRRSEYRHLRRHARALRLSDRAAGGQAPGAAEPDVARRAGSGRERRRLQADRRLDQHADLRRRERLSRAWVPAHARTGRRRHHHARPPEDRRPRRRAADREPGESLLRAVRAAHGGVVPRRHGVLPRLRVGAELPDPRVADVLRHQRRCTRRWSPTTDRRWRRASSRCRRSRASASRSTRKACAATPRQACRSSRRPSRRNEPKIGQRVGVDPRGFGEDVVGEDGHGGPADRTVDPGRMRLRSIAGSWVTP